MLREGSRVDPVTNQETFFRFLWPPEHRSDDCWHATGPFSFPVQLSLGVKEQVSVVCMRESVYVCVNERLCVTVCHFYKKVRLCVCLRVF